MTKRIPKQFYIDAAQNRALKELARQRGCTESELARQALSDMLAADAIREFLASGVTTDPLLETMAR
jgi:predicted transcriptional regulator